MAFWAAIPAIASIASNFLGKKKTGGETVGPVSQNQQLSDFVNQYLKNYVPGKGYTGKLSAEASPFETQGLDFLSQFMNSPGTGELFSAGKQQIADTLGGKFMNPEESPFIKAMSNLSKMNLRDEIDASRARRGARGTYFTRSALKEEGNIENRSLANLDAIIGDFINTERGRQFSAVPIAQTLDQYENVDLPLQKVSSSQTLGALPRLLEQADLERQYGDFQRQQKELAGVAGSAAQQPAPIPGYTNPVTMENSSLANILGLVSKLNLGALGGGGSIWDKLGGLLKG